MGMFDTVNSSYPIFGEGDHDLQTKSLDCVLAQYWISPDGQLYLIDYSYTQNWVEVPEHERRGFFDRYRTVPNGNKGRVYAMHYWGHMHLINKHHQERTVIFEDGVLVDVGDDTTISRNHSPLVSWFSG